jgi:hypothetical protein
LTHHPESEVALQLSAACSKHSKTLIHGQTTARRQQGCFADSSRPLQNHCSSTAPTRTSQTPRDRVQLSIALKQEVVALGRSGH